MFLMNDRHLCCVCTVARFVGRAGRATMTKTRTGAKVDKPDHSQNRPPRAAGKRAGLRPALLGIVGVACSNPAPIHAVDIQNNPLTAVVYEADMVGGRWGVTGASSHIAAGLQLALADGGSLLRCRMVRTPPYYTPYDIVALSEKDYARTIGEMRDGVFNKPLTPLRTESLPYNACDLISQAGRITSASLIIGAKGQQILEYKLPVVPSIPGTNVSCSSETSVMSFGRINPRDGAPTTTARINTTCSSDAAVSVTVNRSKPFIDPNSGATISFAPPIALTARCKVCTTTVKGTMLTAPKVPGRYKWAVPVKIDYE